MGSWGSPVALPLTLGCGGNSADVPCTSWGHTGMGGADSTTHLYSDHRQDFHRDAVELVEAAPGAGLGQALVDVPAGLGRVGAEGSVSEGGVGDGQARQRGPQVAGPRLRAEWGSATGGRDPRPRARVPTHPVVPPLPPRPQRAGQGLRPPCPVSRCRGRDGCPCPGLSAHLVVHLL